MQNVFPFYDLILTFVCRRRISIELQWPWLPCAQGFLEEAGDICCGSAGRNRQREWCLYLYRGWWDGEETYSQDSQVAPSYLHHAHNRLGRISFRTVKQNRDYLRGRKSASWMYLSRLAAEKEFQFMKVNSPQSSLLKEQILHNHGFPVPQPIEQNRHQVVMEFIDAFQL